MAKVEEAQAELEALLADRKAADVIAEFVDAGIPAGRIRTVPEVYDWEQVHHLGLVHHLAHATLGDVAVPGGALRYDGTTAASDVPRHCSASTNRQGGRRGRPRGWTSRRTLDEPSYAVVGGGILGTAVAARRLQEVDPDGTVTLWEKEDRLAAHQTGRNSGVVHAGLYYQPGSLKATLCRKGVGMLRVLPGARHPVRRVRQGARRPRRGRGGAGSARSRRRPGPTACPACVGCPAPSCARSSRTCTASPACTPPTAIVDFPGVTRTLGDLVVAGGGSVHLGTEPVGIRQEPGGVWLRGRTADGVREERFDRVVLCTGLHADHTAARAGDSPEPKVVPFRGEYYLLRPDKRDLVNGLVYPVPDPRYPFLGVHLTPRVDGEVMVGPNAVLALAREGYTWARSPRRTRARSPPTPASGGSPGSTGAPAPSRWPAR